MDKRNNIVYELIGPAAWSQKVHRRGRYVELECELLLGDLQLFENFLRICSYPKTWTKSMRV